MAPRRLRRSGPILGASPRRRRCLRERCAMSRVARADDRLRLQRREVLLPEVKACTETVAPAGASRLPRDATPSRGGADVLDTTTIPTSCQGGDMTAEEKGLEYLFFNLADCLLAPLLDTLPL